ncbi:hypothetical protein IT157_05115 [bacterium]|nr:hypothetical protein [bacterium]
MKMLLFFLIVPTMLWAQSSSENFTLTKSVMDAGGGASSSANFNLVSAFGQPTPIGIQTSENFALSAGFLSPLLAVSPSSPIQQLVIKQMQPDAKLWWEPIPNATSYSIHRSVNYVFTPDIGNQVGTATDTLFTDVNATATQTQSFYIVVPH